MMRRERLLRGLAAAVVCLAFAGLHAADAAVDASLSDRNPKPANLTLVLKDLSGREFSLGSQKGKVLLLDFWATWCGPCKLEIPWFAEFQSKYGGRGFSAVGVSVDDPIAKLKPFADTYKMNYPVLLGAESNGTIEKAYGPLSALPVTFLIGRDGRICRKHVGAAPKELFEREIRALLGVN
jgi:thiol-disulfide isomerase/thioredoxin